MFKDNIVESTEYPGVYYDPKAFEKWIKRFGLEFRLTVDAIFLRNFPSLNRLPVYILFNGEPTRMKSDTRFCVTSPKYDNEEQETLWKKATGKEARGRRITYVFYGQVA